MKYLPGRGALGALVVALGVPGALLLAASLATPGERAGGPPHLLRAAEGEGPLRAGAASVSFSLPADPPIAGYARLSYGSEAPAGPVGARALVLEVPGCKVALVSVELLLVPEPLEEAVLARVADLGLDGVVLAATHTHAGPGGYWRHPLGERIATGAFDRRIFDAVVDAIAEGIRRADGAREPATVAVGRGAADELARSRSGGAEDGRLTVVRVEATQGTPIAEVAVFAAHPTILGKSNRHISGDWPGRFMASGGRGVRLLLAGAVGDQSVEGPSSGTVEAFADALSARVDALRAGAPQSSPALAYAAVELPLPSPDPGAAPAPLRRAARNVASGAAFPERAVVEAVRIGDALLVATPAEPVAAVGAAWRASLPEGAELVSLSGGYVGYVEAPARMADGAGETVRTYYGPALAARLGDAARVAAERVAGRTPPPGATPQPATHR